MNTLHHFGDSYGTTMQGVKHFVEIISDSLRYEYGRYSEGGYSNEQILHKFLNYIYLIKPNDIVFFNFSFFTRGCYYDLENNKIESTNKIYNDASKVYNNASQTFVDDIEKKQYIYQIINYQLENTEDYNRKIFLNFDIIFKLLIERNVKIYYIFVENDDFLPPLLKNGINIKFENGFKNWLYSMDYDKNEVCHYTNGVQPLISSHIINHMK